MDLCVIVILLILSNKVTYSSLYDSKRDCFGGISYFMDSTFLEPTPDFNDQPRNPFKTSRILSLISAILCTFSVFLLATLFSSPFLFIHYRLLNWSSYLFSVTSVLDFQFPLKRIWLGHSIRVRNSLLAVHTDHQAAVSVRV